MIVSELIEKLQALPQDIDVLMYEEISYYGESGYEPISEIKVLTQTVHVSKRELELNKTFLAIN